MDKLKIVTKPDAVQQTFRCASPFVDNNVIPLIDRRIPQAAFYDQYTEDHIELWTYFVTDSRPMFSYSMDLDLRGLMHPKTYERFKRSILGETE